MRRLVTKNEAEKFIREFGLNAYAKAEEAMREARRRKNVRRAEFLAKVMRHIAKHGVTASDGDGVPIGSPPS
ncbi:MAG: hypothetical protein P8Y71_11705 [Pseudolabrys sp.]|jgi:hypothetical protein